MVSECDAAMSAWKVLVRGGLFADGFWVLRASVVGDGREVLRVLQCADSGLFVFWCLLGLRSCPFLLVAPVEPGVVPPCPSNAIGSGKGSRPPTKMMSPQRVASDAA